ncbi:hypothetical protein BC628DRAFT_1308678 [Trametes gibbosa]|nr:hypothetical protein BC628DRAFT_1308678 [Trametes gibbosa]
MRPPHSPAALLATPVVTMPGSLFPRSASLMPEPIPAHHRRAVPRMRTPTPPPEEPEPVEEEAPLEPFADAQEQSPRRGRAHDHARERSRGRSVDDAGPSAARESSRHSETSSRAASSSRRPLEQPAETASRVRSLKGKERACDTSGEIRVRGKEQELREAREDHARNVHDRDDDERERDKRRIRMLEEEVARLRVELALKTNASMMPPPPPPPPPPPLFRSRAPTAAGGTGSFLASARASLKHTDPPVEAPINSVAYGGARTKKAGQPTFNVPSDKMAAFLREMKTVRLRRVGGLAGNTSMGPPASTAGAEAGEMNRSSSGTGMSRARMAATLGDRSFDLGVATRLEIGAKRKRDALEESQPGPSKRRGEIASRRPYDTETSSASSSQSSFASSSQSAASGSQSFSASASSRTSHSRTSFLEAPPPRTQPPRSKTNAPLRIWPTMTSTAETDLTTPSLCSDNENEQEQEDKSPDTPSDTARKRNEAKAAPARRAEPEVAHEVIDVDALETPPKRLPSPTPPVAERKDLFARRPPASPLPASAKSPNKPVPPARAGKSKIPLAVPRKAAVPARERVPVNGDESESDDPLAVARPRPESRGRSSYGAAAGDGGPRAGPSRGRRESESESPSVRSRSRAGAREGEDRMSNHARRRLTLDDEMRRAGDSLWRASDEDEDSGGAGEGVGEGEVDVESGELVGMGSRSSRRGFLAKGGGAGAPVFMGEGYVQGAVADERPVAGGSGMRRSRSGTGESGSRRGVAASARR